MTKKKPTAKELKMKLDAEFKMIEQFKEEFEEAITNLYEKYPFLTLELWFNEDDQESALAVTSQRCASYIAVADRIKDVNKIAH